MSSEPEGRMQGDVLLIGSLPFEDVEQVFRATGPTLRGYVSALPDGEVGARKDWVGMLPVLVFSQHERLEEVAAPPDHELVQPERRETPLPVQDLPGFWTFRVRPGVDLQFNDLQYGGFAQESYGVFRRLRDEGVIESNVRFQACLPAPNSAIESFFEDVNDWPRIKGAYLKGISGEIERMLQTIPADDLAVQFDLAWEVVDLAMGERNFFNFWPKQSFEEKFSRHAEQLEDIWKAVPQDTVLGYHWCYGTWGGWPMTAMDDLSICVRLSKEAIRRSERRVDFLHMPVVRNPDERFFAPLQDLDIGATKVFLGMVHHDDSMADFRKRLQLARRYLPNFGIGGVCGYGRVDPAELPQVLSVHKQCADELERMR